MTTTDNDANLVVPRPALDAVLAFRDAAIARENCRNSDEEFTSGEAWMPAGEVAPCKCELNYQAALTELLKHIKRTTL